MRDYTDVPALAHFCLEESFVLDIVQNDGGLRFQVDAVLTPEHPNYRPPKENEQECYALGWLVFPSDGIVDWKSRSKTPAVDATGERDYGNIDYLKYEDDDHWRLAGSLGEVFVFTSQDPQFVLDELPAP